MLTKRFKLSGSFYLIFSPLSFLPLSFLLLLLAFCLLNFMFSTSGAIRDLTVPQPAVDMVNEH